MGKYLKTVNKVYENGGEYETSPYGWRTDPISGQRKFHSGEDIVGKGNLVAFQDGKVVAIRNTVDWRYIDTDPWVNPDSSIWSGNYIIIEHANGTFTGHHHCKKDSFLVNVGDFVKRGQAVATAGTSGYSTGVHDHFMIWNGPRVNANTVDPIDYIEGRKDLGPLNPSVPVEPEVPSELKFNIGDKVIINGTLYGDSRGGNPGASVSERQTYITRRASGRPYPYNTTGDLGWIAESQIRLDDTPVPTPSVDNGDSVVINSSAQYFTRPNAGVRIAGFAKERPSVISEINREENTGLIRYNGVVVGRVSLNDVREI